MRREITWTWAAEADAQRAFESLEDQTEGSGLALVEITDELQSLLQHYPFLAPVWRGSIRRAILRRTHHGLFYIVEPSRLVVIGLQDLRQDPASLQKRLLGRLP